MYRIIGILIVNHLIVFSAFLCDERMDFPVISLSIKYFSCSTISVFSADIVLCLKRTVKEIAEVRLRQEERRLVYAIGSNPYTCFYHVKILRKHNLSLRCSRIGIYQSLLRLISILYLVGQRNACRFEHFLIFAVNVPFQKISADIKFYEFFRACISHLFKRNLAYHVVGYIELGLACSVCLNVGRNLNPEFFWNLADNIIR